MKIFIVHAAQISASDTMQSIKSFAAKIGKSVEEIGKIACVQGGMPFNFYNGAAGRPSLATAQDGAIYKYKTGKISDEQFMVAMNAAMGASLNAHEFQECWNAMCTISEQTLINLREIQQLKDQDGFQLHVIASSNLMQDKDIKQQLARAGINLNAAYTNSFEVGTLVPAELLTRADIFIREAYGDIEIINLMQDDKRPLLEVIKEKLSLQQQSIPAPILLSGIAEPKSDLNLGDLPPSEVKNSAASGSKFKL